jgi:hypothetical protein
MAVWAILLSFPLAFGTTDLLANGYVMLPFLVAYAAICMCAILQVADFLCPHCGNYFSWKPAWGWRRWRHHRHCLHCGIAVGTPAPSPGEN